MAPSAHLIPERIESLLNWVKNSEAHPLIKSCIFYYEFEFMLESIYTSLLEVENTVQVGEQVDRVELKHRSTFRKNYLLPAIELGYIGMVILDKLNSSKQK
jgi:hypothetical protein